MTATPMSRLRRLWLDVHLWIGVGLLVAIIPLSVSGSALVWHDALDRALAPQRYAVQSPDAVLAPSAYIDAAGAAFGDRAVVNQLRLPQEPGDPVVVTGRVKGPPGAGGRPRTLNAWIDPGSARVLDTADLSQSLTQTLHRLHGTLLIPQVGRKVVGWLGWAMFVSSATGLWLWWPRNGAVLRALRWRRSPSTLFNLHHVIGFWICAPLAVLSLTGVYISFPQTSRALFGVAPPAQSGGAQRPGGRFGTPPLARTETSADAAVAAARALAPGAVVSVATPSQGKRPAWRVQVQPPGGGEPVAVSVSDASGKAKLEPARAGGPDPLSRWMRRVHDGGDMGLVWQTIIFVGGVAPAVLSLTGVVMWLRRRARRKALSHRLATAE